MTFRSRLILLGALAVAVAVAAASAITYVVVRGQLRGEVDDALRARADELTHQPLRLSASGFQPGTFFLDLPGPFLGAAAGYPQVITAEGEAFRPRGARVALPVTQTDRDTADGQAAAFFADRRVAHVHVRVYTVPIEHGFALQIARPLGEVDSALGRIRRWLLIIALGGIGIAAALSLAVARAVLAPVRRLTRTAEEVTETRDLSRRIDERGRDELSRLASSFNSMLAALEDSAHAQRQLVSDASHELRTPLTSLRTNIEVLTRSEELPPEEREHLLRDVGEQLVEMSALVAELVELARGDQQPSAPEDVRLDLVAADAIERTTRNRPGVAFHPQLEETLVRGVPATIERAVSNLLDNAAKWSPPGGEVDVVVRDGELVVRDRGPGIAQEDVPFIFDRFYRAPSARGMPGSGLGLAIVRQVAESHGGTITVEAPADGGTRMRLKLPVNGDAS